MKSIKFQRLCLFVLLVPTVSSLIISSVYAGKKKFKTFSFGHPLLPAVVKVQPNKFHLTFRQYKYLRTPQFKIEGTLPLKAPTIIKDVFKPDPNPEVTEFNFGDMSAIPEANQHLAYDGSSNQPIYAEAPQFNGPPIPLSPPLLPLQPSPQSQPQSTWRPINTQRPIESSIISHSNHFPIHHRIRRFANEYNNQFNQNPRNPYFNSPNFGQNFEIPQNQPSFSNYPVMAQNSQSYSSPPNLQNYGQNYFNQNMGNNGFISPYHNSHSSQHSSHNDNSQVYPSYPPNPDMATSPSSFSPPKYERVFAPSNHQNNKWIPINTQSAPPLPQRPSSGQFQNYDNIAEDSNKKVNIGEHYNPSASYMDETLAEKPTYDPDDSEPDEGSVSFSISGPHGGEEVPLGYEKKIKEMHEQLKDHPHHLPPGMDMAQIMKYYSQHTFTDTLKNNYGYKPAFGALGFLKSKLKSWKKII